MNEQMNEQMKKLAEQVSGKIHWGAPADEVRDWLQNEKRISPEDAEQLILLGFKARRREVRERAIIRIIFAGIGLLLFGGCLFIRDLGYFVFARFLVSALWGLAITAMGVLLHSIKELLTGESDRPM